MPMPSEDKPLVFVVDDDPEIRVLLSDYLGSQGFDAMPGDGGVALDRLIQQHGNPHMIVLDLMMPGEDGLAICRRLRGAIPIIMLTAKGDDIDRIVGLEMGADDYLPKPFNPRELVARIRAILRRNEPKLETRRRLRVADLVVDLDARVVARDPSGDIGLTSAEFELLACFVTRPGRVLSRDQLMDWTRGRRAEALDRTIDVQLSRLRRKIESDDIEMIKTVRNAGYIFIAPVAEE